MNEVASEMEPVPSSLGDTGTPDPWVSPDDDDDDDDDVCV